MLNYVSGGVSYAKRGELGEPEASVALDWVKANFDQPVCEDMSLRTDHLARARIRIGADAIEMSDDTVLHMLNLRDRLIEASVAQGRIYLQLSKLAADENVEIEIPRGSLYLSQPGGYDIEVGTNAQAARVTVFEGKARFVGGAADTAVAAGGAVEIAGIYPAVTATDLSPAAPNALPNPIPFKYADYDVTATERSPAAPNPTPVAAGALRPSAAANPGAAPERNPYGESAPAAGQTGPAAATDQPTPEPAPAAAAQRSGDDFLVWTAESKNEPRADQSARYVSPQTTGYDELDRYGRWEALPDGRAVWFPYSVPADWAPYRFGHWVSIAPWGWTWVDDEPWGFAPFHYGRWIDVDGRWGWVPGPVQPDPVYAPALVAFIDPDAGDPYGGPDVGWFPLGPDDGYVPWYAAGPAYVERVNVGVVGVGVVGPNRGGEAWQGHYFNRQFATVVPRDAFAAGRPVALAMARIPPDRLAQAPVMHGAPRVAAAAARPIPNPEFARGQPSRSPEDRRPEVSQNRSQHGGTPQYGGTPQRARTEMSRSPAAAYRGGGQQFGRRGAFRNATEASRGGPQQFRGPEGFRTPAPAFGGRGFPTMGGGMQRAGGGFGGGGAASRHK